MPDNEAEKLAKIDLSKISLHDVMKLENPVLRQVIGEVVKRGGLAATPEHTSHGTHTDHLKEPPKGFDPGGVLVNPQGPVVRPGPITTPEG